ncbi:MAG: hypothetical protein Ct9H90mP14_1180 [Methanobacteriota archaeon]|nr:MAG: hypothetical protein Ct9H90mP14_1180 [Euryarchaeota archaeon]
MVAALHIYVDGSCEENRNVTAETPAGWGFCVVEGDTGLGRGPGGNCNRRFWFSDYRRYFE